MAAASGWICSTSNKENVKSGAVVVGEYLIIEPGIHMAINKEDVKWSRKYNLLLMLMLWQFLIECRQLRTSVETSRNMYTGLIVAVVNIIICFTLFGSMYTIN